MGPIYVLDRNAILRLLAELDVPVGSLPTDVRSMRVALDDGLKVSVDSGVWTLPMGEAYR